MNQNLKSHRVLTYADMKAITTGDSDEPLVSVRKYDPEIVAEHNNTEMQRFTGDDILVRDAVARKLARVNAKLGEKYNLKVEFGYRHPSVQKQYFEVEKAKIQAENPGAPEKETDNLTHVLVAMPDVAGHPMGAAVDITIVDQRGDQLDMGSKIRDFDQVAKMGTFVDGISDVQMTNRMLLHDAMIAENFAPFYGEWWHFSYGDREWAAFYGKARALYDQITV